MSPTGRAIRELPFVDPELVPYEVFLEYRARRLRSPSVANPADPPDGVTAPAASTLPRAAVACIDPPDRP